MAPSGVLVPSAQRPTRTLFDHPMRTPKELQAVDDERRRSFAWTRLRSFVHMSSALSMVLRTRLPDIARNAHNRVLGSQTVRRVHLLVRWSRTPHEQPHSMTGCRE